MSLKNLLMNGKKTKSKLFCGSFLLFMKGGSFYIPQTKKEGMNMNELQYYEKIKDWDFSQIHYITENYTNWDLYEELNKITTKKSKILDLGTGGGEKLLEFFPECQEILGTDYSPEMIETANNNLNKSGRKNITFKVMNNLEMTTPNDYYDVVVARHTIIDAKQIYNTLKKGGHLLVRGVDKIDCWSLKLLFGHGQCFFDEKAISQIDYEDIINAGFKKVELIPLHVKEYYQTKEDLIALLVKAPILEDFSEIEKNNKLSNSEKLDLNLLDKYIKENTSEKGILLIRRYYGIIATK